MGDEQESKKVYEKKSHFAYMQGDLLATVLLTKNTFSVFTGIVRQLTVEETTMTRGLY